MSQQERGKAPKELQHHRGIDWYWDPDPAEAKDPSQELQKEKEVNPIQGPNEKSPLEIMSDRISNKTTRRNVLIGAGAAGVGLWLLLNRRSESPPTSSISKEVLQQPQPKEEPSVTSAREFIQALLSGNQNRAFELLHPEIRTQYNLNPLLKEDFFQGVAFIHRACSNVRLTTEFTTNLDPRTNERKVTFFFDRPCSLDTQIGKVTIQTLTAHMRHVRDGLYATWKFD